MLKLSACTRYWTRTRTRASSLPYVERSSIKRRLYFVRVDVRWRQYVSTTGSYDVPVTRGTDARASLVSPSSPRPKRSTARSILNFQLDAPRSRAAGPGKTIQDGTLETRRKATDREAIEKRTVSCLRALFLSVQYHRNEMSYQCNLDLFNMCELVCILKSCVVFKR